MEVGPTCHYMMGGIRVEAETAQSTVAGLFAAGEAAAGLHGANRLGGNSLSDLLVFGRRAGVAAAEHAKQAGPVAIDEQQIEEAEREMLAPFERAAGDSPYDIHRDLQETMQNYVGIFRNEDDLEKGLSEIQGLKERAATTASRRFATIQSGMAPCSRSEIDVDGFGGSGAERPGTEGESRRAQPNRLSRTTTKRGASRTTSSCAMEIEWN